MDSIYITNKIKEINIKIRKSLKDFEKEIFILGFIGLIILYYKK